MRAQFHDSSGVKNGDAVGVAYGRNPVGNENRRTAPHDFAQVIENLIFRVRVYAGECIVENQNAWITNDSACNCGSLLLASGNRNTALTYQGSIFLRETLDFLANAGCQRS